MKEFWIYTGLRVGLFIGAFCIVFGVWFPFGSVNVLAVVIIAFLVSGLASYVLLGRQRAAFAGKVETRASRITEKFEEARAKEDDD